MPLDSGLDRRDFLKVWLRSGAGLTVLGGTASLTVVEQVFGTNDVGAAAAEGRSLGHVYHIAPSLKNKPYYANMLARIEKAALPCLSLWIGTDGETPKNAPKVDAADTSWIGDEGYVLKTTSGLSGKRFWVIGMTPKGAYYGLIGLINAFNEHAVIRPNGETFEIDHRDRPAFKFRSSGDRSNFNLDWFDTSRYNIVLHEDMPEVYPEDPVLKQRHRSDILHRQATFKNKLCQYQEIGSGMFLHLYMPVLPEWSTETFYKAHPEALCQLVTAPCMAANITKHYAKRTIDELFTTFPTLDGLVIAFRDGGADVLSTCDGCRGYSTEDRMVDYTMLAYEAMRNFNPHAKLFVRNWALPDETIEQVQNRLPADSEIYIYYKMNSPPCTDDNWSLLFNQNLSRPHSVAEGTAVVHIDSDMFISHLCYEGPWQERRAKKLLEINDTGTWGHHDIGRERHVWEDFNLDVTPAVAWQGNSFNSDHFIKVWSLQRFGKRIGPLVADALRDTTAITDAFILDKKELGVYQLSKWDPREPDGYEVAIAMPDYLKKAGTSTLAALRDRFAIKKAHAIAENARVKLTQALELSPRDAYLKDLNIMAALTCDVANIFSDYHTALAMNQVLVNEPDVANRDELRVEAASLLMEALKAADSYLAAMERIYPFVFTSKDLDKMLHIYRAHASYPTFTYEEVIKGYNQMVMVPTVEKMHKVLWTRFNPKDPVYTEDIHDVPTVVRISADDQNAELPNGLVCGKQSTLEISFTGDLSHGGALVLDPVIPLDEKELNVGDTNGTWARSEFRVSVNDRKLGRIRDYSYRSCQYRPTRYVLIPPMRGEKHSIIIEAVDGTGASFKSVSARTP